MPSIEDREADAAAWGRFLNGPDAFPFSMLEINGLFRFAGQESANIYHKLNESGWYTDGTNRYRTGRFVSVVRIKLPESDKDCHECGEPFCTDENGVNNHIIGGIDEIDYDADIDHVPFSLDDA